MKVLFKIVFIFVFIGTAKFSYCQEPLLNDPIGNKVIISFPDITTSQLNLIKVEFLKYNQIETAKYIYGNHNLMLITFNTNESKFTTYAELLKVITPFYNTENCFFKVTSVFNEILNGLTTEPIFQLK
ncbi:MAG: hypothetical protein Q8T03_15185 [Bacteroidota bacterium]|nr:hypothetical protein [Bacteroidota bacterium]